MYQTRLAKPFANSGAYKTKASAVAGFPKDSEPLVYQGYLKDLTSLLLLIRMIEQEAPFPLTDVDKWVLSQTDEEFKYHDWDELREIISELADWALSHGHLQHSWC